MEKETKKYRVIAFKNDEDREYAHAHFEVVKKEDKYGIPYEVAQNIKVYGGKADKDLYRKVESLEGLYVEKAQEELKNIVNEYRLKDSGKLIVYEVEKSPYHWDRKGKKIEEVEVIKDPEPLGKVHEIIKELKEKYKYKKFPANY